MSAPRDEPILRRDLCRLAARLLADEVDGPLLAALRATGRADLLDPELAGRGDADVLEELAVEYCRLFVGPDPVCRPWASAHRRRPGAPDLGAFLTAHGLEVHAVDGVRLPGGGDHLAVYMAVLGRLYDDLASGQPAAVVGPLLDELIDEHLRSWAGPVAEAIRHEASVAPYGAVGAVVSELMATAGRAATSVGCSP